MDYPTLAAYHGAGYAITVDQDYHHHRIESGHVFGTSSVPEGVRDDRCLVNYTCSNDDARFIDATAEMNGKRVSWVFEMMGGMYEAEEEETMVTALLEGKEEDVWLWVDGDEDHFPLPHDIPCLHKHEHRAAVQALRRRQEAMPRWENCRNAEMRSRVQSESLPVRMAAIAWLIMSSKAMKKLDNDHGKSDAVKWDLAESIREWYNQLDNWKIWDYLPMVSASYLEGIKAAMVANGHSCHRGPLLTRKSRLARWLRIQNVLFGESAGGVVNFMFRSGPNGEVECKGCLYYESYYSYYYPLEQHPSYEPSRYSVFLAVLYYSSIEYKGIFEWVSQLRYSYPHLFTAGKVLSKTFTDNLPSDRPNMRYLPWVNAYPEVWRWRLTDISSEAWKTIDTLSNQQTLGNTQPDSMTWLLAILFSLTTHRNKSKSQQIQDFYDFVKEITSDLFELNSDDIKVPATSGGEDFCRKVETSAHTSRCWDNYDPGWYAAAVAYLYDEDDIEFVPLLQPDCQQCGLTCAARTFADKVSDSSSLDSSMSALENLVYTLRDHYEQSSEIALLRATLDRIANGVSTGRGDDNLLAAEVSVPHDQLEAIIPTLPVEASGTSLTASFLVPEVSERTEYWLQRSMLKLSHDDMLNEVRSFLINTLLKAGAYLNLNKGEYTLPWSQLRSKLVEWKIEMVNWPEEVPLKDKKKGINGLNSHFVQCLYRAIHDKEHPLHFRRIAQMGGKRTTGDCDDREEGPSAKRPNTG